MAKSSNTVKVVKSRSNGKKTVTRYTYDDVKERGTPETGQTALLPSDEEVVSLSMEDAWASAIEIGRVPEDSRRRILIDMDPAVDPVLFWSGKRTHRYVPVLPLQRNEVVSDSRIAQIVERARRAAAELHPHQTHLFADLEKSFRESERSKRVGFYTHEEGWKNKLICGDSLQVMESLLNYENLRGKVKMIYIDPPYGIKYDSNFQQRVDSTTNDKTDGGDDVLTIRAFRDTWVLGIHSYLSYLQERLYLCRELLSEKGSLFVQIGEGNVHRVRALLDEVLGAENFVTQITFLKTSSQSSEFLSSPVDYLLWYARDKKQCAYFPLFQEKEIGGAGGGQYTWIEEADGTRRPMTKNEIEGRTEIASDAKIFRPDNLCSARQGRAHEIWPVEFNGRDYYPTGASTWKTNKAGMERLKEANRLIALGKTLCYVRYLKDFPVFPITNIWNDTVVSGFSGEKFYVVQTSPKVVARCIAMTTKPGDLVLDITCGGGTTAYSAEYLGRRWITCDTSRVAVNVTRNRLLSAVFPSYRLQGERISDDFQYESVPRVTMGSITGAKEPETVALRDHPIPDDSSLRVTGPFEVMSLGRYSIEDWKGYVVTGDGLSGSKLENYIEVVSRLYRKNAAVQGASGLVHAIVDSEGERFAISVGPLSGRVTAKQIQDAVQDAMSSGILEVHVLGWAFEPNVGEVKSQLEKRGKVKIELVMIRPDTLDEGLKATRPDMLFSPLALPDIEVAKERDLVTVRLNGVALFDRKTRATEYKAVDSGYIAAWYLDEDYDGDCFVDCQMFYDFKKAPNVRALVGAPVDSSEFALKLSSEPFEPGRYKRIAVKVVDVYGNESTVVRDL